MGKPLPTYDEEAVERGLLALAECGGNSEHAARLLAEDGLPIDARTLRRWRRDTYPERYERVRQEALPRIRQAAADAHLALSRRQIALAGEMTDRLAHKYGEIPARDLAGSLRNVSVSSAVHSDKAALLDGQPTAIVRRDFGEIKRLLRDKGIVLDGTAVEIDPAAELPRAAEPEPGSAETDEQAAEP